jgi:DNA (cytosine-5)-methyltransferase 1
MQLEKEITLNELALFAGAGGGILGGKLLGWRTVCAVEIDAYAASVLCARQNDGILAPFPIWDDVRTFDGRPWRGVVDVVSGGFPCQDISAAGKGAGIDGERSGLWSEFARIIREVGPRFVFVENSPMLTSRGLGRVLGDLAEMGYDARWGVLGAADAGAPHQRDRIWIRAVANADCMRGLQSQKRERNKRRRAGNGCKRERETLAHTNCKHEQGDINEYTDQINRSIPGKRQTGSRGPSAVEVPDTMRFGCGQMEFDNEKGAHGERPASEARECSIHGGCSSWWSAEPAVGRVAHGVAYRVDRLKAIGNGQVSAVAALAWKTLNCEGEK